TSRAPLRLHGEWEYAVDPLPEEDAVELLVQRARRVRRDFAPDECAAEICRHLDGLPLALELAAARLRAMDARTLLERLDRRLPLLTGGARDAPERQRTLRGTIEWSYDLLSAELQELFSKLAVFAGTFSLEAAEVVAEATVETLAALAWALEHDEIEFGLALATALEQFWMFGYTEEGMRWFRAFLERADDAPPLLRAPALRSFASSAHFSGDFELAERSCEESLAI